MLSFSIHPREEKEMRKREYVLGRRLVQIPVKLEVGTKEFSKGGDES